MTEKLRAEWFWTDRWRSSSAFLLPMEARGLYREMLTAAWTLGACLPNDHEAIRMYTGCLPEVWKRCWPLIEAKWKQEGSKLVNETQREIFNKCLTLSEKRALAGARGGKASGKVRSKPQANVEATPQANPKQTNPPSPSPSKDQSPKKTTDSSADADQRVTISDSCVPIFDLWVTLFSKNGRTKLTKRRRGKIRARLQDSTQDEVEGALRGFASNPWRHEAANRNELGTLLRNREQVEAGLAEGEARSKPRQQAGNPGQDREEQLRGMARSPDEKRRKHALAALKKEGFDG